MKKIIQINTIALLTALVAVSCSSDSGTTVNKTLSMATVTTNAISNIDMTSAMVAGEVTADGNATVTERGVCWGLATDPTVSNDKKSMGTGTGSFSVSIDALTEDTKYFVRAYAINSEGVAYGTTKSFTTAKPGVKKYSLGDMFEGGVIFHLNSDSTHGLAYADTTLGIGAWGCFGTAITGAIGFKIGDGAQNTKDILKGCSDVDCAAKVASDLSFGGFTGWHLPSRDELLTLHRDWISQGKGKMAKGVYWTSTQNSNNKSDMAQTVNVGNDGAVVYQQKDDFANFRAVAVKEF